MLGFRVCPRLRDLPDRRLACIEPRQPTRIYSRSWPTGQGRCRSRTLGRGDPSDRVAEGRYRGPVHHVEEAQLFDWLGSPERHRRRHAGLNKSELRHFLAQVICTFKQGRIADRGAEAQQFRASRLNLVIAAIVYWNSTYIADAVAHLRVVGEVVPKHCSPTRHR
jgi:TnpA family transposase